MARKKSISNQMKGLLHAVRRLGGCSAASGFGSEATWVERLSSEELRGGLVARPGIPSRAMLA